RVFAIGDTAYCLNAKTGGPVPAVARAAIEQGVVAATHIAYDIAKAGGISPSFRLKPYHPPKSYSTVIPIGGKYAIAKIGPVTISGFFGWILKGLIELNYLLAITSPLHALAIWVKGLWIFTRNDRLG
ncbi:MAG: hypothetical protein HYS43_01015, partial [Candidatus Liptonbacteria bacterium]|nr:hypothetical protein [Candidatus Liptonbacteria bacterium]